MSDEDHPLAFIGRETNDVMTVGDLRRLLSQQDASDAAPILIAVYNDQYDEFEKMGVLGAEMRSGWNVPPALVLTYLDPEKALG